MKFSDFAETTEHLSGSFGDLEMDLELQREGQNWMRGKRANKERFRRVASACFSLLLLAHCSRYLIGRQTFSLLDVSRSTSRVKDADQEGCTNENFASTAVYLLSSFHSRTSFDNQDNSIATTAKLSKCEKLISKTN